MLKVILMVGIGGFAGSVSRYLVYLGLDAWVKAPWIPLGTLVVNVAGCFAIGLLAGLPGFRDALPPEIRGLIFVGFLGGFTTFSTFGLEIFAMADSGRLLAAAATMCLHLFLGVAAVWLGFFLGRVTLAGA